jgi:hypothetical protein
MLSTILLPKNTDTQFKRDKERKSKSNETIKETPS